MKFLKSFMLTVFSATLAFGLVGCEQQGVEGNENKVEKYSDLTTLLYETIESQGKVNPREKVYIVAHRANTDAAIKAKVPENSLEIIEMAIESGVIDMVELDVRPTKDGELVLMHDESIARTTTGTGSVSNFTYAQLLQFDMERDGTISKGIKVPTLRQAFALCKDKMFINLDIHSKAVPVGQLAALIEECGMTDQVMIYSTKDELVEYAVTNPNLIIHPYVSSVNTAKEYKQYPGAMLFQYGLKYDATYDDFPKKMREAGFMTYTNILNQDSYMLKGDYSYLDKFIASETDFIQTDRAELVHEYLKQKGLR